MLETLEQIRDLAPHAWSVGEELAAALAQVGEEHGDRPLGFFAEAWPAYLRAIQKTAYWFSCDELLWFAECAEANLILCKTEVEATERALRVEGVVAWPVRPIALVSLFAHGGQRVRSHFERLCPAW